MKELSIFQHPDFGTVRNVVIKGEPWFMGKDICQVLGIANHKDALGRLDEDERCGVGITDPLGRQQEATFINESGLYSLIMQSRKPEAKSFKKWVTSEVLPSIRKYGYYISPTAQLSRKERNAIERSYLKALDKYITEEEGFEKDALLGQPRPERAERIPPGQRRDARAAGPRFGQQEPMGGRLFSGQDGRGTLATAVNPPAMNNTRRKSLRELIEKTEGIKQEIEEIKTEEEEYYNNMPSSVQDGEKGDRAQTVIEYLDEAMTAAGDVIENLTSAAE